MNHRPTPPAPPRRTRRTVLVSLAVIAPVAAMVALRRPLLMAEPVCASGRWHGCYDTDNGVLLIAIIGLPLSAAAVCALALYRRTTGATAAWSRSLAEVGMVHGTVPFIWITLMPGPGAGTVPGRLSLVPLRDLATMGLLGIGGNLLILAALGFFAPIRFAALATLPRVLALGAGCSALIETAQYALRLDRVSSVDDVLLNAAGAALFGLASHRWWRTPPPVPPPRPHLPPRPPHSAPYQPHPAPDHPHPVPAAGD